MRPKPGLHARFANYIGSPELFGLTKQPFLEMFARNDVAAEDLRIFAEWLTTVLIANQLRNDDLYPLTATEARAALRRAGDKALPSVGHRLADRNGEGRNRKIKSLAGERLSDRCSRLFGRWISNCRPPPRPSSSTQILRAAGEAFPEAADVIIPFIRPDDPRTDSTVFSIAEAPEELHASLPARRSTSWLRSWERSRPGTVYSLDKALEPYTRTRRIARHRQGSFRSCSAMRRRNYSQKLNHQRFPSR